MANIMAISLGALPLMLLIGLMKIIHPRGNFLWIYGVACILVAAFSLWSLDQHIPKILGWFYDGGAISNEEHSEYRNNLKVWVYLCPAVIAAIGANFISSYLLLDR